MHKVLKYIYLGGTKCRRLNRTVHILLKFVRDKQFQRIIKLDKGKVTCKIHHFNKSHLNAINAKDLFVTPTADEKTWSIQSGNKEYSVLQNDLEQNHKCHLKCTECDCCIHLFSCSCMDLLIKANICKHIHKVAILTRKHEKIGSNSEQYPEDEVVLHLETLNKKSLNISDNIKQKSIKINNTWTSVRNTDTLKQIDTSLEAILSLIQMDSTTPECFSMPEKLPPANKKIQNQPRFQSTKKKRTIKPKLGKPTKEEAQNIISGLKE